MSSCQDHKYNFHLDTVAIEHTKKDTYLGLNISGTCNFHKAVNDLRDKTRRTFYAIKRNINLTDQFDIPEPQDQDEPGEESPKQAGPGALFTNTPQGASGQQHN